VFNLYVNDEEIIDKLFDKLKGVSTKDVDLPNLGLDAKHPKARAKFKSYIQEFSQDQDVAFT
jgi:hypothetical protein